MKLAEILPKIPRHLQTQFLTFIDEGESTPEFDLALDNDPSVQEAVELAFVAKCDGLESFAKAFRDLNQIENGETGTVDDISSVIADSLNVASALSPEDGRQVVALTAKKMAKTVPESVGRLRSMLSDLQEHLDEMPHGAVSEDREEMAK